MQQSRKFRVWFRATSGPATGMICEEFFSTSQRAREVAMKRAAQHGVDVRVSTKGAFGSFTVPAPEVAR
jgi:hypothetical protein